MAWMVIVGWAEWPRTPRVGPDEETRSRVLLSHARGFYATLAGHKQLYLRGPDKQCKSSWFVGF